MHKIFNAQVKRKGDGKGSITISTSDLDRDGDIVEASGAVTDAYRANPIVLFGHEYRDAEAVVGRTTNLDIRPNSIRADFELRPPAHDTDKQHVVRLLFDGGWINAASIGFRPLEWEEIDTGFRYTKWELLEWSLVSVPSQSGATRATAAYTGKKLSTVAPLAAAIQDVRQATSAGYVTKAQSASWRKTLDDMTRTLPAYADHPDVARKMAAIMSDLAGELRRY